MRFIGKATSKMIRSNTPLRTLQGGNQIAIQIRPAGIAMQENDGLSLTFINAGNLVPTFKRDTFWRKRILV